MAGRLSSQWHPSLISSYPPGLAGVSCESKAATVVFVLNLTADELIDGQKNVKQALGPLDDPLPAPSVYPRPASRMGD